MFIHEVPNNSRVSRHAYRSRCPALLAAGLILLWGTGLPALTSAETFFVSAATGSDSNPGTDSEPFSSIQRALEALAPGDDITIRAGRYSESPRLRNLNATAGDYTEISAESGATVSIAALNDPERPEAAFLIEDSSHIRLQGIRIDGSRRHGIGVFRSSDIGLIGNTTYNTGQSGIRARYVNDILLDGNDVSRAVQRKFQESISLSNADGFVIRNNLVHDRPKSRSLQQRGGVGRGGEGIDVKDGSRNGKIHDNRVDGIEGKLGIYVDAYDTDSFNIEIFDNVVTNSGCGFAFSTENGTSTSGYLRDVKVYNNVSYGNRCGMYFGNHGGDSSRADKTRRVENISVYNNTIVANGIASGGGGIDIANPNAAGLTIRNNLVVDNRSGQIRLTSGLRSLPPRTVIENNLVAGSRGAVPAGNNLKGKPGLLAPSRGDFRLTAGSAAIDAGLLLGAPAFDHRGVARPQGPGIDIGAFEYTGAEAGPAAEANALSRADAVPDGSRQQ